jgi:hypothetical protein
LGQILDRKDDQNHETVESKFPVMSQVAVMLGRGQMRRVRFSIMRTLKTQWWWRR